MKRGFLKHIFLTAATALTMLCAAGQDTPKQDENKRDTTGIADLRRDFARTARGAELLRFADSAGVHIAYDSAVGKGNLAEYDAATSFVSLRPGMSREEDILYLAHEIRHAWQDKFLDYTAVYDLIQSPAQRFAVSRFVEADAAAYSTYFYADRLRQIGYDSAWHSQFDAMEFQFAAWLKDDMRGDSTDLDFYRNNVLPSAFGKLPEYDATHISDAGSILISGADALRRVLGHIQQGKKTKARHLMDSLVVERDHAMDTDAVIKYLRRYGGISLNPRATTAFQTDAISDTDIISGFPLLELRRTDWVSKPNKDKIDDLEKTSESLSRAIDNTRKALEKSKSGRKAWREMRQNLKNP